MQRGTPIRQACAILIGPALVWAAQTAITQPAEPIELLQDADFERGFKVYDPRPGRHVLAGLMQPEPATGEPIWGLAQWSSRHSLAGVRPQRLASGAVRFQDESKAVTFQVDPAALIFTLNGKQEYGKRFRRPDEPWAHLLAEQRFKHQPRVVELQGVHFRIECRLRSVKNYASPEADLPGQAAQFLAYLSVQNLNRQSPGYGDYLWFGIQMYDSRYRQPKAHAAMDTGGTGKFIYNPPGSAYTSASAHDGEWLTIDRDLLPLIHEGLQRAWKQGHLKQSRELSDFRLSGFNIGWELPGTLDVEMEFRNLSIQALAR